MLPYSRVFTSCIVLGICFLFCFCVTSAMVFHFNNLDEQESANSSSLLDLGFDGPAPSNSHKTNTATSENSFLDEQFKLLG